MTHNELVIKGAKWLKNHERNIDVPNCKIIASELTSSTNTGEIPDIIGWCSWTSILIEVKVSRSDFLNDNKKIFRQYPDIGMGEFRYYMAPEGLINKNEIPDKWGLLTLNKKGKINIEQIAERQLANLQCERTILLSIIRRKK